MLILDAFEPSDPSLGLRRERSAVPVCGRPRAHRLLQELTELRLLERDVNDYRLGGRLFELGMLATHQRRLLEVAMPFMQDLVGRVFSETVHLAVGERARSGLRHQGQRAPSGSLALEDGRGCRCHCKAVGKMLLAHADRVEQEREILLHPLPPNRRRRPSRRPGSWPASSRRPTRAVTPPSTRSPPQACPVWPPRCGTARGSSSRRCRSRGQHPVPPRETHVADVCAAADGVAAMIARREALFE